MRIWIDYKPPFGRRGVMEVIAEEFTIPGVSGHQFAVHNTVDHLAHYTATHVATGFAVGRGDTPEEAIEKARAQWLSCPPEELALKLIRAKNLTGVAQERERQPA